MINKNKVFIGAITGCCLLASALSFASKDGDAALAEMEAALQLEPNLERGKKLYLTCSVCHRPEGWGTLAWTPRGAAMARETRVECGEPPLKEPANGRQSGL